MKITAFLSANIPPASSQGLSSCQHTFTCMPSVKHGAGISEDWVSGLISLRKKQQPSLTPLPKLLCYIFNAFNKVAFQYCFSFCSIRPKTVLERLCQCMLSFISIPIFLHHKPIFAYAAPIPGISLQVV